MAKKITKFDGSNRVRDNFPLFQRLHDKFLQCINGQHWTGARETGKIIVEMDISGFHEREVEKYNNALRRVQNALRSMPQP